MARKSLVNESMGEWLDCTGHMYMEIDRNLVVTFANAALKARFGSPGARECYRYLCGAEEKCEGCAVDGILQGTFCGHTDLTCRDRQDQRVFLHSTGAPIKDEAGSIVGAGVLMMDVSRTHRMEEMVRESHQRYQQLVDRLPDLVFSLDPLGRFTFVNSQCQEMLACSSRQVIGKSLWDFIESEDNAIARTLLTAGSGKVWDRELGIRDAGGVQKHVHMRVNPRFDNQGNLLGFEGVMRDRTAQWELEQEVQVCQASLSESQHRYWSLVEEIPDIVFDLDASGRFAFVSPRTEEFLGYSPLSMQGTPLYQYVAPEERPLFEGFLALQPGEVWDGETALVDAQGNRKWVRIRCKTSLNTSGEVTGFEGVMADKTERKNLEEELEASRKVLLGKMHLIDELRVRRADWEKSRAIEEHAAELAHELKQPLTVIGGFVHRMAKKLGIYQGLGPDKQPECYYVIMKEVKRLEGMLRDLVNLTKPETLHLERVALKPLIEDVIRIGEESRREKNLKLELDFSDEVQDAYLDPARFQHVLRNMVTNAVEASPRNETIGITVGLFVPDVEAPAACDAEIERYIQIKIRNTGKPIPPRALEQIFDPFYTTKKQGTGIGLALVKKIIEKHHGSVSVQSDDKGTIFTLQIPLAPTENSTNASQIKVADTDTVPDSAVSAPAGETHGSNGVEVRSRRYMV
ncbi:MAG: PAS domain S-box protein [Desulfomonilaceae bacterium]|nr:PAS domain S-box protein [Desulfomonilaceae bacterium]